MAVQCIITGCDLLDVRNDRFVHGDLHWISGEFRKGRDGRGVYIFNAVTDELVRPRWFDGQANPHKCQILLSGDYFERRGVFVIDSDQAELNAIAKAYIS